MRFLLILLLGVRSAVAQQQQVIFGDLLGAASRVTAPSGTPNVTDGLVGWWKLNDGDGTSFADSSGYGNNGTASASMISTNGPFGQAGVYFPGNIRISCGNDASLDCTNFTITAWVYPITNSLNGAIIGKSYADGWGPTLNSTYLTAIPAVSLSDGSGNIKAKAKVNFGTWTMHVCISSNGTFSHWTNNVFASQESGTALTSHPTQILYLGGLSSTLFYYTGLGWDFRIYNRVLSSNEIVQVYNWRP